MTTIIRESVRSHNELCQRVQDSIIRLGYPELASVHCESEAGAITLKGDLTSYYLRQIAQTVAMRVPGVRLVKNEIHLIDADGKSC